MADNEFREIIRLGDKDIRGNVPMGHALTKPKGSSYMFANAVCKVLNLDIKKKCGEYTVKEVEKIEDVIRNPAKYNIPTWLMNRRRDRETGEDKHILSSDLDLTKQYDMQQNPRKFVDNPQNLPEEQVRSQLVGRKLNNGISKTTKKKVSIAKPSMAS